MTQDKYSLESLFFIFFIDIFLFGSSVFFFKLSFGLDWLIVNEYVHMFNANERQVLMKFMLLTDNDGMSKDV